MHFQSAATFSHSNDYALTGTKRLILYNSIILYKLGIIELHSPIGYKISVLYHSAAKDGGYLLRSKKTRYFWKISTPSY